MSKRSSRRGVVSLYGGVAMERGYCSDCEGMAFVQHGKLACCGKPYHGEPKRIMREAEPEQRRRKPSADEQKRILAEQDCRCIYCGQPFGSLHWRDGKLVVLNVHWDHDLPYAFSQDNRVSNFVAACHVCNLIKSSHLFRSLEDAQAAIAAKRELAGYDF